MIIRIKDEGRRFFFALPTCLIFNAATLGIAKRYMGAGQLDGLTPTHMKSIRRCIKKMKKIHKKDWYLCHVQGSEGEEVRVKL